MVKNSANWLKIVVFLVFLLKFSSSAVIPDPEFDVIPHNWILTTNNMIMMRTLPKESNYTFKEYYASWGKNYDTELAMKDLANASVIFVNRRVRELSNLPRNFSIVVDLLISECEKASGSTRLQHETIQRNELMLPAFYWRVEYCPTRKVVEWCDSGERLEKRMAGEPKSSSSIPSVLVFSAQITAKCPTSFWRDVLHVFREKDAETWHFRWPFYLALAAFAALFLALVWFLIKKLVPRRAEPQETGFWVHRVTQKTSRSSESHSKSYSSENEHEFTPRRK